MPSSLSMPKLAPEASTSSPTAASRPAWVAVLVAHGAAQFTKLDEIHIRVGGLPQNPKPPLDYQLVFSVEGLINEYVERARVIRDGRITMVDSMTEVEEIEFPEPFGKMEAFQTSGGHIHAPRNVPRQSERARLQDDSLSRPLRQFKTMIDLGLCSSEKITVDGVQVAPRRVLGDLLVRNLPADEPDVVLVRVEFVGDGRRLRYDIIDRYDEATGLSAMMRTTAFPASIVGPDDGPAARRRKKRAPAGTLHPRSCSCRSCGDGTSSFTFRESTDRSVCATKCPPRNRLCELLDVAQTTLVCAPQADNVCMHLILRWALNTLALFVVGHDRAGFHYRSIVSLAIAALILGLLML